MARGVHLRRRTARARRAARQERLRHVPDDAPRRRSAAIGPLVVTDLDGTLWGRDCVASPATRAAVAQLQADGVPVLAATARRVRGARLLLDGNRLALPLVGLNGALGRHPDGASFHAVPFAPGAALAALGAFEEAGLHPCVYVDEPDVDVVLPAAPSSHPGHLASLEGVTRTADLGQTILSEPVYAFSVLGRPEGDLTPVAVALDAAGFGFDCAPEPIWPGWGITAMAPGVSKWAGVLSFCAAVGCSPHDVLAVGDNTNDIDMLQSAAWSLAVAGSTAARLLPDAPTIGPPARDGWAEIPALLRRRAAA